MNTNVTTHSSMIAWMSVVIVTALQYHEYQCYYSQLYGIMDVSTNSHGATRS